MAAPSGGSAKAMLLLPLLQHTMEPLVDIANSTPDILDLPGCFSSRGMVVAAESDCVQGMKGWGWGSRRGEG